ncbi:MAG: glycoside hydrolase family 32 protein [Bacteroidota bacterium]|nr:glycoside hydrolase family 32 protein [Bacteroidota bacterium]
MKKFMQKKFFLSFIIWIYSATLFSQESVIPTPQWRPLYHFTPLKNWTNDPNGLIYINGVYHLYNQQNPFENKWGHMSWGHATSSDLVNWKHLPIAMPEAITNNGKNTTWRFSGCAVLDKNNTSGLCKNGSCIVAIYTADQPDLKKESQFIAYSNDGGMHFTQYAGNPVIDLHMKDFRDPNVTWNNQLKKWLMVVSLPQENKVRFYASGNLKNWDLLSEFGNAGLKDGIWECPSFFQLPVEGHPGKKKWVLMTSFGSSRGTMMQYFVGNFDGKNFTNDNPPDSAFLVDNGDCFYAAIPWNNLPDNQNIFIGWMVPPSRETFPWRGQMSIPRDLSLRETKNGTRLFQEPAAVIKNKLSKLSGNSVIELKSIPVNSLEENIFKGKNIRGNSYWLEAELSVPVNGIAGFKIAQKKDKNNKIIAETVIGYDASKHQLYVDRTNAGNEKINRDKLIQTAGVMDSEGEIKLEILFDKSSLEVFINNGEKVLTTYVYPDNDAGLISAFSVGGKTSIQSLKFWNLSKIK